jgi:hypothetical protein
MNTALSQLYSDKTNRHMKRIEGELSKCEPLTLANLHRAVEPAHTEGPSDIFYLAVIRLAAERKIGFRHEEGTAFLIYKTTSRRPNGNKRNNDS